MKEFISYKSQFLKLLTKIVKEPILHSKWLNTLSYLENCGARKISSCEHPTKVKEEVLKHAAEEFRHAHYLKKQLSKISVKVPVDYSMSHLLGSLTTKRFLDLIELVVLKHLKKLGIKKQIKEYSYALVTYAIELRAFEVYEAYQEALDQVKSKVRVKSIFLEEVEHLNEIEEELNALDQGKEIAKEILKSEAVLCKKWLFKIEQAVKLLFYEENALIYSLQDYELQG